MKSTCEELRQRAWDALSVNQNYWYAVLLFVVYTAISGALSGASMGFLALLAFPMAFAFNVEILGIAREKKQPQIENLFSIYRDNFGKSFLVVFLVMLFVGLWSLLLVIPGIIMAYAYSMSVFVSHDNPELPAMDCIKKSRELMNGHKWDLFVLDLSFIGWILLACLTFGFGFLFLQPYIETAHAEFYKELVDKQEPSQPEATVVAAE